MDATHRSSVSRKLPVITAMVLTAALIVAITPTAPQWLIYDRQAILHGEIWRLFTCHWVHFSASHLLCDALTLGITGYIIELEGLPRFGRLVLTVPWVISVSLILFEPRLNFYGGLSGVAVAAIVFLLLSRVSQSRSWKSMRIVACAGLAVKFLLELKSGHALVAQFGNPSVLRCKASHLAGAAAALVLWWCTKEKGSGRAGALCSQPQ